MWPHMRRWRLSRRLRRCWSSTAPGGLPAHAVQHMLSTLELTDPLGVSLAFRGLKATHDAVTRSPVVCKEDGEDAYHVPLMAIPSTMVELIAAKQSYMDYTLAKNEHKLTRIKLEAAYAASPEMYAED